MDRGHLGIEFDVVVDGNPEHRPCLGRGRRADDGVDLGDEPGGRSAQRGRRGGPRTAAWRSRLRRWRGQPRQFLIVGDGLAFADQQIGDLGSFLIDADHRFAARHDESGDPHEVGEAGIGGFRDDDQSGAGCFLLFGVRAMLKPVPGPTQDYEKGHG